ncbi:MAG TPA: hypothetical protein GX708_11990, partial [Gallicola sp.]|nr:hypothetical protein [Gallicola sp.]
MNKSKLAERTNMSTATIDNWSKVYDINNINIDDITQIISEKNHTRKNKKNNKKNLLPKSYIENESLKTRGQQILDIYLNNNFTKEEVLIAVLYEIIGKNINQLIEKE